MILVTGGAGYIGSHTVLALMEDGYNVYVIDNFSNSDEKVLEELHKLTTRGKLIGFEKIDITRIEELRKLFQMQGIKGVIHLAGCKDTVSSMTNYDDYYFNNIFGTRNIVKVMKEFDVNKLVFSSSCSIYKENINPVVEIDRILPKSIYARTKLDCEQLIQDYEMDHIILRYFNVVGCNKLLRPLIKPNENVLNKIIKSCTSNTPFVIYGKYDGSIDGSHVRDYVNVEDVARANVSALEKVNCMPTTCNICTGTGTTVKHLITLVNRVTGKSGYVLQGNDSDYYIKSSIGCNSKARDLLKWTPTKGLRESIEQQYEWVKEWQK